MNERGPKGDHGQAGDSGQTGQAGQTGQTGQMGQTGLTGLTGQTGQTGLTGQMGHVGPEGDAGPEGPQGPRVLTRGQVVAGFLFVVFCFLVLAWRTEVADDNIRDNTDHIRQQAEDLREVQQRTSDVVLCPLYQVFIDSIDHAPPPAADRNRDGTVTEIEQADYDQAVRVIRAGYAELGCAP